MSAVITVYRTTAALFLVHGWRKINGHVKGAWLGISIVGKRSFLNRAAHSLLLVQVVLVEQKLISVPA